MGQSSSENHAQFRFGATQEHLPTTVQNFIDGKLVDSVSGA